MMQRDPIETLANRLMQERQLSQEEWARFQEEAAQRIEEDYLRAESAADVEPEHVLDWLYAPAGPPVPPPIKPTQSMTMVSAVNETLRAALKSDDRVIMMGESEPTLIGERA